jgi:ABC-type glycerol-3-phosphate transport system substrate-binding protein
MPANAANKDAAWYFMQYITNKQNEPIIGAKHGGAARMSTWDNPVYADTLNPEYVSATLESMKTTRSSVVMKEGWAKYALEIDDVIQRIYEGTSPEESAEIANKQFLKFNAQ